MLKLKFSDIVDGEICFVRQKTERTTKNRKEIIKAFQTHAVDTTGAGDSFWGGVLCSILSINKPVEKMEWEEIRKCAVLGNAVAGLCVQKRGGIPAIPTKEAVFEFMQK